MKNLYCISHLVPQVHYTELQQCQLEGHTGPDIVPFFYSSLGQAVLRPQDSLTSHPIVGSTLSKITHYISQHYS